MSDSTKQRPYWSRSPLERLHLLTTEMQVHLLKVSTLAQELSPHLWSYVPEWEQSDKQAFLDTLENSCNRVQQGLSFFNELFQSPEQGEIQEIGTELGASIKSIKGYCALLNQLFARPHFPAHASAAIATAEALEQAGSDVFATFRAILTPDGYR